MLTKVLPDVASLVHAYLNPVESNIFFCIQAKLLWIFQKYDIFACVQLVSLLADWEMPPETHEIPILSTCAYLMCIAWKHA